MGSQTKGQAGLAAQLWAVGEGGMVAAGRVVAVGRWDSAPIRRAARKARAEGRLIDLTFGQACAWVIFLDSGHVALGSTLLDSEKRQTERRVRDE